METERYRTKFAEMDAVQVTPENIHEVAEWCGGVVKDAGVYVMGNGYGKNFYIDFPSWQPDGFSRAMCFIDDWVLWSGSAFKHCKKDEFNDFLTPAEVTVADVLEVLSQFSVEMEGEREKGISNPFWNLGLKYAEKIRELF